MAAQQHSDSLPANLRNQFPSHRFRGDQTHGPTRLALGRLAANHPDNPLFFSDLQELLRATPLAFEYSVCYPSPPIAMGDPPHRLRRHVHDARHRGCGVARRQLLQDHTRNTTRTGCLPARSSSRMVC